MNKIIQEALVLIKECDGRSKSQVVALLMERFSLTKDRSVFYRPEFAIRFSSSKSSSFSNTVISLSNLRKYDHQMFLVCLITPNKNIVYLANTTLLKKISDSSQQLRIDNIRGSLNGSDISKEFEGIANAPQNFERLFHIHEGIGFDGNLLRLVEATNDISPTGAKFEVSDVELDSILKAPKRAIEFSNSPEFRVLKKELDQKVERYKTEILLAALIENVNIRGRIIEYIIAGEDERLRSEIIAAIRAGSHQIPPFKTDNTLRDYRKIFDAYDTKTDVKTKIMALSSNPKAYNLDKILDFLSNNRSVFMFYFVGVDPGRVLSTVLVSIFQVDLLRATILLKHWAGRNSRGVSQFEGKAITRLIGTPSDIIDEGESVVFLKKVLAL